MKAKYFFIMLIVLIFTGIVSASDDNNSTGSNSSDFVPPPNIEITKFFPKEVKLGDVQFNIQVKNNLESPLKQVYAFISGEGFSTYKIIPIENLGLSERDYIFVDGHLSKSGNITLTIQIEGYVFYQEVYVIDIIEDSDVDEREVYLKQLAELSVEVEKLKKDYLTLELVFSEKKDNGYDVSEVKLDDLKKYIRNADSFILAEDYKQASVNFQLALEEFEYQKNKLDNVKIIPLLKRWKENALVFSAIFGSILAFFALSELLRKKSEGAIKGISSLVVKKGNNPKTVKNSKRKS